MNEGHHFFIVPPSAISVHLCLPDVLLYSVYCACNKYIWNVRHVSNDSRAHTHVMLLRTCYYIGKATEQTVAVTTYLYLGIGTCQDDIWSARTQAVRAMEGQA